MNETDFRQLIQELICPLLAGSALLPERLLATPGHALAAVAGQGQVLHLSPSPEALYKVAIGRPQKFAGDDVRLAQALVAQLVANADKTTAPYQERVLAYAVEVGICRFLSAAPASGDLLVNILDAFEDWSARTYEGRKPTFTIVVALADARAPRPDAPLITEFLSEDFFAPLSNGVDSGVRVSAQGALLGYVDFAINSTDANTFAPARFISVANCAEQDNICLTLTNNGEVLIFKDQKLFFSKRNGAWNYYNDDSALKTMPGTSLAVRKAMYETILDVSFARTGGCLVAIPAARRRDLIKDDGRSAASVVKRADLLANPTSLKSQVIGNLVRGRRFQDLSRAMRKELVGIDGATIIQYQGEILAVGAIVKISGGSVGGGRLAATRTLAPFGAAIKISADGMVEAFKGTGRGTCEAVFTL